MPTGSSWPWPRPTRPARSTSGYAISSSPSRTSAAVDAGSTSQMTGLIAAVGVAVVLVLLTGPLASLPIPALGAVILVSVIGLIDVGEMRAMWFLKRSEGIIAFIAMAGVILYGTLIGVGIAVLLAALNIVRRAAWPKIAEEGRLSGGVWRDVDRFRDAQLVAGVLVVRFTGPLFFANATALETRIRDLLARHPDTSAVVIDLVATADIDLTSADVLHQIDTDLERDGRRLAVARPSGHLRDELQAYGLAHLMEPTNGLRGSIDDAIVGLGLDPTATVERDESTGVGRPDRDPRIVDDDATPTNRLVLRVLGIGSWSWSERRSSGSWCSAVSRAPSSARGPSRTLSASPSTEPGWQLVRPGSTSDRRPSSGPTTNARAPWWTRTRQRGPSPMSVGDRAVREHGATAGARPGRDRRARVTGDR